MKKRLAILLTLILTLILSVVGLTACGETGSGENDQQIDWNLVYIVNDGEITGLTKYGNTLPELVIPETINGVSITSIGYGAFYYCTSLASIEIPNSVTSIGELAFYGCNSLTSVNYTGTIDTWAQISFSSYNSNPICYAKKLYINNELVTEVNITTATLISDYAFYDCSSLTSVTIGNSVKSIGSDAFSGCRSLTSIEIPNSVKSIGKGAFENCTALKSVEIPNSVTSIGEDAFYWCKSLTSIEIPNSVTSIGDYAFYYCYQLTSIEIPNSVTSIGDWAFYECTALEEIIFDGTMAQWNSISKGYYLSYNVDATVYCTDGNITI